MMRRHTSHANLIRKCRSVSILHALRPPFLQEMTPLGIQLILYPYSQLIQTQRDNDNVEWHLIFSWLFFRESWLIIHIFEKRFDMNWLLQFSDAVSLCSLLVQGKCQSINVASSVKERNYSSNQIISSGIYSCHFYRFSLHHPVNITSWISKLRDKWGNNTTDTLSSFVIEISIFIIDSSISFIHKFSFHVYRDTHTFESHSDIVYQYSLNLIIMSLKKLTKKVVSVSLILGVASQSVTRIETSRLLLQKIESLKVDSRSLLIQTTRRLNLINERNDRQWFEVRHQTMTRVIVVMLPMMVMTMIGRTVGYHDHAAVIQG